jgi:hypothetical protein
VGRLGAAWPAPRGPNRDPQTPPFAAAAGPAGQRVRGRQRPVEGGSCLEPRSGGPPPPGVSHPPDPSPSIAGEGRSVGVVPSHDKKASRGGNRDEPTIPPSSPFRGQIRGQGARIHTPRPSACAAPPLMAGLDGASRHQGRWSAGAEAPRAAACAHRRIKARDHRIRWRGA